MADDQSGLLGQRGEKERGVTHSNDSMNGEGDEVEEQGGFLLYRGGEFAWGTSGVHWPTYPPRGLSCGDFRDLPASSSTIGLRGPSRWSLETRSPSEGDGGSERREAGVRDPSPGRNTCAWQRTLSTPLVCSTTA